MKKVIRLTESQLNRYIKSVISEQPVSNPDDYADSIPAPAEPVAAKPRPYAPTTANTQVSKIQQDLITLGYDVGPTGADGYMGPDTAEAIKAFQGKMGMLQTGKMDEKLLNLLSTDRKSVV